MWRVVSLLSLVYTLGGCKWCNWCDAHLFLMIDIASSRSILIFLACPYVSQIFAL